MAQSIGQRLREFVEHAKGGHGPEYWNWANEVSGFLSAAFDATVAHEFFQSGGPSDDESLRISGQVGFLDGLALRIKYGAVNAKAGTEVGPNTSQIPIQSKRVFVVHGHDEAAKELVARFLGKLKLEPIILHEQPNSGRTIIEKFEAYADVGFAVVLLTPDDVGASAADPTALAKRARQNVVLELGYFVGRIGRNRVCALHKAGVEIPSDYHGVLFVELDGAGGWRTKLAQELVQAKLDIDIKGLLEN
jgi:predicted nucleotide-binding protein